MSDHLYPPTTPTARLRHVCAGCGAGIPVGETYVQQNVIWEGRRGRNRFHQECWDDLSADGEFEFTPGGLDPPARFL